MAIGYWLKRIIPQSLGGPAWSVYTSFFTWLRIPHEYRLSLRQHFLHYRPPPKASGNEIIRLNRTPLWNWIKEHKPERILEVGLGNGVNVRKMIELSGGCTYFCFDDLSANNFKVYDELRKKPNTEFYIGDSVETLPRFADSLPKMDLIFIDGAHDRKHVENDWNYCKGLMHSSTACFFHDYEGPNGVKKVVESINDSEFKAEILIPSCPPAFALVQKR